MKKNVLPVAVAATCSLAVTLGCQSGANLGSLSIDPASLKSGVAPVAASVFSSDAKLVKTISKSRMANVNVKMQVKEAPSLGFRIQALPGTWTQAVVQLYKDSTTNGTFDPTKHVRTIPFASFVAGTAPWVKEASASFPPLKPAAGYNTECYVQNDAGTIVTSRLAGSQTNTLALVAGNNNLDFIISVNGKEATYNVASSTNGNNVSGNQIVKDDALVLNTGIATDQVGVDRIDLKVSGLAYPGGPVIFKRLTRASDAATWDTFTWDTAASDTAAPENYNAATFNGTDASADENGDGTAGNDSAGQIDVEAYNAQGRLVGKSSFGITVLARPTMTVRLQ